jgi:hypothetical protein
VGPRKPSIAPHTAHPFHDLRKPNQKGQFFSHFPGKRKKTQENFQKPTAISPSAETFDCENDPLRFAIIEIRVKTPKFPQKKQK